MKVPITKLMYSQLHKFTIQVLLRFLNSYTWYIHFRLLLVLLLLVDLNGVCDFPLFTPHSLADIGYEDLSYALIHLFSPLRDKVWFRSNTKQKLHQILDSYLLIAINIRFMLIFILISSVVSFVVYLILIHFDIICHWFASSDVSDSIFPTIALRKGNIKQNNLSLKTIKAELEAIKSSNNSQPAVSSHTITTDKSGKQSVITRFVKGGMPLYWIISTLLTYGHKIPIISKIIKGLSLWYGRTTWWKILVQMRKVFIVLNAIIGVITVFKITGFSTDNLLAGFYGIGYTYVEMLGSFIKRLFTWFVELFDHKIVPNPPTNPNTPSSSILKWWAPKENTISNKGVIGDIFDIVKTPDSLRETYKHQNISIGTSSGWSDWSISSWVWYGGIALISVGALYLGYKFVMDPTWFLGSDIKGKAPFPQHPHIDPTSSGTTTPTSIPLVDTRTVEATEQAPDVSTSAFAYVTNRIYQFNRSVLNAINPLNYIKPAAQTQNEFNAYMDKQIHWERADTRYYPFTEINPYATFSQKMKLLLFGESDAEKFERLKIMDRANRVYDMMLGRNTLHQDFIGATPSMTPQPATSVGIGFNTPIATNTVWETIRQTNLSHKLDHLLATPAHTPNIRHLADVPDLNLDDVKSWSDYSKEVQVDPSKIASSSNVKVEDFA
jgi:hypothetical protein